MIKSNETHLSSDMLCLKEQQVGAFTVTWSINVRHFSSVRKVDNKW